MTLDRISIPKKAGENKKLRDHYISQFYLREFSISEFDDEEEPSVWVYDLEESKTPKRIVIKNVAKIKNFYEQVVDDALTDIEGKVAPLFRKLRNGDLDLTNIQEKYDFGKFVCFLTFQTPRFREDFEILVQNTLKSKLVEQFNQRGTRAVVDDLNERTNNKWTSKEFIDSFNKIKIKPPVGSFPEILGESLKRMIPKFCVMKWHFLRSDSERCFITSDAPVVMHNPNNKDPFVRYGYAERAIQIIFPINRTLCLLAGWTGKDGYYVVNRDVVQEMNTKIAQHARRFLFSPIQYDIEIEEM